ncbi:MAG TPA: hypothetical protein VE779_13530 [Candidatus Angelobacter sp.]|jgi:hypothetical protein|nr:hypothetical protein [Candidatus Angelobacter sp.]
MADEKREFLRYTLATLAYRGGKAVRGATQEFAEFRIGESPKTPAKILAHIGDLLDWAAVMAEGKPTWHDSEPLPWDEEAKRFHAALQRFDEYLASERPLAASAEVLFQGPIADALTHVGQIAMLRRLAGVATKGENYAKADIVVGRVGAEQTAPKRVFD